MHQDSISLHGFTIGCVSLRGVYDNTVLLRKRYEHPHKLFKKGNYF
jgi:hypothetical protein